MTEVYTVGGLPVIEGEKASSDTITGGDGAEFISAGNQADSVDGGGGDDVVFGGQGDDTVEGGTGDDVLVGGSVKLDDEGDLKTVGGGTDEHYQLQGTGGIDTFVFNFNFEAGLTETLLFRDGNTPDQNADWEAWYNYIKQLDAWQQEMVSQGYTLSGEAQDAYIKVSGTIRNMKEYVAINGGDTDSLADYLADSKQYFVQWANYIATKQGAASVAGLDGHDVILGFEWGEDKLQFDGLTKSSISQSEFEALLNVQYVDDGVNSGLELSLGGWSVRLVGLETEVDGHTITKADFYDMLI